MRFVHAMTPLPPMREDEEDRPSAGEESAPARAIIERGAIVIRLPIANLPVVVDGAWAAGNLRPRMKVTDAELFARELCRALNDEEEDGTTRIHLMFDAGIEFAMEQGFEGIEEHEDQEGTGASYPGEAGPSTFTKEGK